MTIASEITKLQTNLSNSYDACENKDATMPESRNFDNLADCISSIKKGFYCTLYVYAPSGTEVTVENKTQVVYDDYVTFELYGEGEYLITGVYDGHTQTQTVYVYEASYESVSLVFYSTISVSTQPNVVLTCDGETITATGTSVDFTVYETGTYTITGSLNGHTNTTEVEVYDMGDSYSAELYLYSNLDVSSENGAVITVNGESKTVTDTSVSFVIWQSGTVTITAVKDGVTKTRSVDITLGTDYSVYISFSSITEVDYIQGDGGYINTGFFPEMGDVYTFEVERITAVASSGQVPVWGSNFTAMNNQDTTNKGVGFGTYHADRQVGIRRGLSRYWNSSANAGNWAQKGFITFVVNIGSTNTSVPTVTENGTSVSIGQESYQSAYNLDNTVPIGIFCSIYNGSAVCVSNGLYRLRYFKVTRGGNVVADFRAAIDANNVAGLYDRVSQSFVAGVGNISYQE